MRMPVLEDEFGDVVRKAREGTGLGLDDLARRTGIDARRIERLERYEGPPERRESDAIARELGLDSEALWRLATGAYRPRPASWTAGVRCERFVLDRANANCFALWFESASAAVVIDPGAPGDKIARALAGRGWPLAAVLVTHGHWDHVAGLEALVSRMPAPVYAHGEEWRGEHHIDISGAEEISPGGIAIRILPSPGHTPSGVSFLLPGGLAAVGDTLFAGSLGRAYQGPAYYGRLLDSARRLVALPPETILLPGHGPVTTVGEEAANNPFLAGSRQV